ncbi:helix-turn-helix domain-containing protein [Candidatus Saccharibacteria bacterium]|nr:helix-turn-helix domain-containing protein [Candidatus Saccharibacteria bacterium]
MPIVIKHIEPSAGLRPLVHRFWEVSTTDAAKLRVLPDGSWDFVVHVCGDSYQLEFVGPMTKAAIIPLTPDVRSYGVRFLPGVYFESFKTDLADYQDMSIPLTQLMPTVSLQTEEPILPQLAALIKTLVERGAFTRNQVVDENLAKPLSSRTVERKFRRYVGLSPKQFARINRQLAVAQELLLRRRPNLGHLAADLDYVDQAHMTHDIRLLAGTTPKALHDEYDGFLQYDWPYKAHTSKA